MTHFKQWLAEKELEIDMIRSSDEYFQYRKDYDTELALLENEPVTEYFMQNNDYETEAEESELEDELPEYSHPDHE